MQKASGPAGRISLSSPTQATASARQAAPVAQTPAGDVSQLTTARQGMPAPAAPVALAQNVVAANLPAAKPLDTCSNPDGLGISRVVEIDTTGGPAFGTEHFKQYDFLRDHEVVLTFDDGPWPGNTERVLKALADNCTKALFFPIGKHAGYHPEILKEVA
ncbi:MAG: polysaccharide deacetylase family protein, partial [Xanthobacteraceae bacterium]